MLSVLHTTAVCFAVVTCVSCLVVVSSARECPHDLSKRPYKCTTLQLFLGKLS